VKVSRFNMADLKHIDTWLFDLDNTLYPSECDLFALIDQRMGLFIQNLLHCDEVEARRIQKDYFYNHGTTLSGLMTVHNIDPHHFLEFVHDIPMDRIVPNPELKQHIDALTGRKLIYTNGNAPYVQRVLNALGLGDSFEEIFDIVASDLIPKPAMQSYQMLCDAHNIDGRKSFFADDMARNLRPAKALGMATLWINNGSEQAEDNPDLDHIDHHTDCLTRWLGAIREQEIA
jgi:putative hydrolase of the HAD superfamily